MLKRDGIDDATFFVWCFFLCFLSILHFVTWKTINRPTFVAFRHQHTRAMLETIGNPSIHPSVRRRIPIPLSLLSCRLSWIQEILLEIILFGISKMVLCRPLRMGMNERKGSLFSFINTYISNERKPPNILMNIGLWSLSIEIICVFVWYAVCEFQIMPTDWRMADELAGWQGVSLSWGEEREDGRREFPWIKIQRNAPIAETLTRIFPTKFPGSLETSTLWPNRRQISRCKITYECRDSERHFNKMGKIMLQGGRSRPLCPFKEHRNRQTVAFHSIYPFFFLFSSFSEIIQNSSKSTQIQLNSRRSMQAS